MIDFAFISITYLACRREAAEGLGFLKSRSEGGKINTFYLTLENFEVY